ncbi:CAF17-like 4Fe-4S cluster assembly/insertion protein YgfZ [Halomonas sp. WWR20]
MNDWTAHLEARGAHMPAPESCDFGDGHQARLPLEKTVLAPLPHLGVLEVDGVDAKAFLQGQTSTQVSLADGTFAPLTAFCTAKGRMLANAQLLQVAPERYWLILDTRLTVSLHEHLGKFAVFYKLAITVRDDIALLGLIGEEAPALLETCLKRVPSGQWSMTHSGETLIARHPGPMPRFLLCTPQDQAAPLWDRLADSATPVGNAVWQLHDIQAGLAWMTQAHQDTYLPQMLNWEALGGISFRKGCYTGQEVVARAHFRGQVKKRLMRAKLEGSELPSPGTPVENADGKKLGDVFRAAADADGQVEILAVVTTRDTPDTLQVNGVPLTPLTLPYAVERLDPESLVPQTAS